MSSGLRTGKNETGTKRRGDLIYSEAAIHKVIDRDFGSQRFFYS